MIGIMIGFEIAVQVLTDAAALTTPLKIVQQSGRLLVTAALCYFLYRGHPWARWALVVLLLLGIAAAAFYLTQAPLSAGSLYLIVLLAGYAVAARILLWSKPAKGFLAGQRAARGQLARR